MAGQSEKGIEQSGASWSIICADIIEEDASCYSGTWHTHTSLSLWWHVKENSDT